MKITLEEHGTIVTIQSDDVSTDAIIDNLLLPALLAMGHSKDNIDGFIMQKAYEMNHDDNNFK